MARIITLSIISMNTRICKVEFILLYITMWAHVQFTVCNKLIINGHADICAVVVILQLAAEEIL